MSRPNTVHVYFDQHPRYILGPIGIPQVGERYTLKGVEMEVTGIDPDHLAIAFAVEHLDKFGREQLAQARSASVGDMTPKQIAKLDRYVATQTKRNKERLAAA